MCYEKLTGVMIKPLQSLNQQYHIRNDTKIASLEIAPVQFPNNQFGVATFIDT
jgi:hypothetical protein